MALPVIADTYRCAINYSNVNNSLKATNVIHVFRASSTEAGAFEALNGSVEGNMWSCCTTALVVDNVTITKLDGTPDGVVFSGADLTGNWPDGSGAQQFVPQACALVKLTTAATGRSGRGRVFLPFVQEGAMQDGQIVDANRTATNTAWGGFTNTMITSYNTALCVASYVHSSVSQVLNLGCERTIATQRKRNRR